VDIKETAVILTANASLAMETELARTRTANASIATTARLQIVEEADSLKCSNEAEINEIAVLLTANALLATELEPART